MRLREKIAYGFFAVVFFVGGGFSYYAAFQSPPSPHYVLTAILAILIGFLIIVSGVHASGRAKTEKRLHETTLERRFAEQTVATFVNSARANEVLVGLAKLVKKEVDEEEQALTKWKPPEHAPRYKQNRLRLEKLKHHRDMSETEKGKFDKALELVVEHKDLIPDYTTWEEYAGEKVRTGCRPIQRRVRTGRAQR